MWNPPLRLFWLAVLPTMLACSDNGCGTTSLPDAGQSVGDGGATADDAGADLVDGGTEDSGFVSADAGADAGSAVDAGQDGGDDSCAAIPDGGTCDGDLLVRCVDEERVELSCADLDGSCDPDSVTCQGASRDKPCDDVLVFCADGLLCEGSVCVNDPALPLPTPVPLTTTTADEPIALVLTGTVDVGDVTVEVTAPAHGTLDPMSGAAPLLATYTPAAGYVGPDELSFVVSAGGLDSAAEIVHLEVHGARDDALAATEDTALDIPKATLLGNDFPATLTLASISVQPSYGTLSVEEDLVRYTPAADSYETDSFSYVTGTSGTFTAVVTIAVAAVNDAPVAVADQAEVEAGLSVDIAVLGNDTDVEGDALTLASVTDPPNGAAILVDAVVRYTPDASFSGSDTFGYVVEDGQGGSASGTITVEVTADPCGNGVVEDAEQCDDGNGADSDGCEECLVIGSIEVEPNHDGAVEIGSGDIGDEGNDHLSGGQMVSAAPLITLSAADATFLYGAISPAGDEDVFELQNGDVDALDFAVSFFAADGTCPPLRVRVRNTFGSIVVEDFPFGDSCRDPLSFTLSGQNSAFVHVMDRGDDTASAPYFVAVSAATRDCTAIECDCSNGTDDDNDVTADCGDTDCHYVGSCGF